MIEVSADQLKQAIESQHGGTATFVQSAPVREAFEGRPVWEGVVHVFDFAGHPKATRAYAWSSPVEGPDRRRFFAVLHLAGSSRHRMRCGRLLQRSIGTSHEVASIVLAIGACVAGLVADLRWYQANGALNGTRLNHRPP
jgi:hypothetical protein